MANIVEKVLELSGTSGYDDNGSDFDLLRDSVITAGLAGALSDEDASLTVFAPTDAAFVGLAQTLGYTGSDEAGSLGYIVDSLTLLGGGDPIPLLTQVLTYHVTPGEFFLADVAGLGDGAQIPTLQGGLLTLDLARPGLNDLDPGVPDPNLIGFDVDVSNGVIHVLDGVLLPLPVSSILSAPDTDFEIGNNGREFFMTREGNDFVDGNGGNDVIRTGSGNDVAIGGSGNDFVAGGKGDDIVIGESGNDKLFGGRGNDVIEGGSGRDKIFGNSGDDTINGGSGNDHMFGGGGNDDFVFENGSGRDIVFGFNDRKDQIDLSGYEGIEDFSDIEHDIKAGWFGARLELEDGDSVLLVGVSAHRLDSEDFIFA